jgi:transposase
MASTTKRRFTDEFKREAVALWESSGRMQTEVAAELGIMPTMVRRWQRKLGDGSASWGMAALCRQARWRSRQYRRCRRQRIRRRRSRGCGASWTGRGWSATY